MYLALSTLAPDADGVAGGDCVVFDTTAPMNAVAEPAPPSLRGHCLRAVFAAVCFALAIRAPDLLNEEPLRGVQIEGRIEACVERADGTAEFVTKILEREAARFGQSVRSTLFGLGIAALIVSYLAVRRRGRSLALPPAAIPLVAATLAAAAVFAEQVKLAFDGARDGLFTESEEARLERAFDIALAPSRFVMESVPRDARIVVIDFPAPHVLQKFGYLVHPRKVFVPPHAEFRFSAADVRTILREMPHGIDWCFEAGYTHLVDLTTLVATGDPNSIIELAALPR